MNVDDCKKAFNELRSRGVEFKQAQPEEYAWGISATFSDPDGNLLLDQPKTFFPIVVEVIQAHIRIYG